MGILHILRVLFAIALSGAAGWACLVAFNILKIMKGFEAMQAASDNDFGALPIVFDEAVRSIEGGSALFLAAGIAGVLLSEILKSSSILFYAAATGALAPILAAAFWQHSNMPATGQAAASLAMAGFVAGGVYWMLAGYAARPGIS